MCVTFVVNKKLQSNLKEKLSSYEYNQISFGDYYPGMKVAIIENGKYGIATWGLTVDWSKKRIHNARSETVMIKPTFNEDYRRRKCVVLASGFYEFDKNKQKYCYSLGQDAVIFMAGFIRTKGDQEECVIMTQTAPLSCTHIQNRIPLLIEKENLLNYFQEHKNINELTKLDIDFNINAIQ